MLSSSVSAFSIALVASAVFAVPAPQASTTPMASCTGDYATIPASCPQAATGNLVCYQCESSFPSPSAWLPWNCLASLNRQAMVKGNDGTVDGPQEADDVLQAICVTAEAANIDPRIILAQVMQESVGFVRAGEGDSGKSYGLMQVQLPSGPGVNCGNTTVNTCPYSIILEMIQDGVFGHVGFTAPQAPGIGYWITAEGGNIAKALRGYNTGSVPDPLDLADIVATDQTTGEKYFAGTQTYVSDVANRLMGYNAGLSHTYSCNLDIDPNTYVPGLCT